MERCHRFHTLLVSSSSLPPPSASPQRGFDFLITEESELDGTTAESHKGSSGVAGHLFTPPQPTALPVPFPPPPATSPPADVSGRPQSDGVGAWGVGGDESCNAGCVRRICGSDQQLHRGDIKVVEACGAGHLALQLAEAGVAANTPTPTSSLPPTSRPAGSGSASGFKSTRGARYWAKLSES